MKFEIHDLQTAPEASKPVLAEVEKAYKFIPNLMGVLAESQLAVAAYAQLDGLIQGKSSLTPPEQQAAIAVSYENGCEYCMGSTLHHRGDGPHTGHDEGLEGLEVTSKHSTFRSGNSRVVFRPFAVRIVECEC
ncbi:MAG: hypothetical protein L0Z50_23290 [Verrucomicrobiales bacterium]|nr:hypothetical protein [Verrucomicrobiales bacterium]